jgi:hypothetical protein
VAQERTSWRTPEGRRAVPGLVFLCALGLGSGAAQACTQAIIAPHPEKPGVEGFSPLLEVQGGWDTPSPESFPSFGGSSIRELGQDDPGGLEENVRWGAYFRGDSPTQDLESRSPALEAATAFLDAGSCSRVGSFMNHLLALPESFIDTILVEFYWSCLPQDSPYGEMPVTLRLIGGSFLSRRGTLFTDGVLNWSERERRFLEASQYERHAELEFGETAPPLSTRALEHRQVRILLDAFRQTWMSKYKAGGDPRAQVMSLDSWSGIDYLILPHLALGFICFKGLDESARLGDFRAGVSLEAPYRWALRKGEHPACLGIEFGWDWLPVRLIVSMGFNDGKAGLDFVGLGTSLSTVRDLILLRGAR